MSGPSNRLNQLLVALVVALAPGACSERRAPASETPQAATPATVEAPAVVAQAAPGDAPRADEAPVVGVAEAPEPGEAVGEEPAGPPAPDGVFAGRLRLEGDADVRFRFVVHGGRIVSARLTDGQEDEPRMRLQARGTPTMGSLRLMGKADPDYLGVTGAFVDGEEAEGDFVGALGRRRVQGRWYALRQ